MRHIIAQTPPAASFEEASLEKRGSRNCLPHFKIVWANPISHVSLSSVGLSSRTSPECGPDLTLFSLSPFCCSNVSCAWERSTLRHRQDAPSVGNGYYEALAVTLKPLSVLPILNIVRFSNSECPATNSFTQRCVNALLTTVLGDEIFQLFQEWHLSLIDRMPGRRGDESRHMCSRVGSFT